MSTLRKTLAAATRLLVTATALASLWSCQGEPDDLWSPDPAPGDLLDQLRVPQQLPLAGSGEVGSYAAARAVTAGGSSDFEVTVTGGQLELWATEDRLLVIDDLVVEAADVAIGAEVVPPAGVQLTGLRARLVSPVAVAPTRSGDRLTAIARLDLEIDWSMATGGDSHPLSPLHLSGLPFSLDVVRSPSGQITARLVAFRDGRFWEYADLWSLADLTLDLLSAN